MATFASYYCKTISKFYEPKKNWQFIGQAKKMLLRLRRRKSVTPLGQVKRVKSFEPSCKGAVSKQVDSQCAGVPVEILMGVA